MIHVKLERFGDGFGQEFGIKLCSWPSMAEGTRVPVPWMSMNSITKYSTVHICTTIQYLACLLFLSFTCEAFQLLYFKTVNISTFDILSLYFVNIFVLCLNHAIR